MNMKVFRVKSDGKLLVFPEGNEFRAFKRWMLAFGKPSDDYYDATAGCYIIRSQSVEDLEIFGFKVERLSQKQYGKMVGEALSETYYHGKEES